MLGSCGHFLTMSFLGNGLDWICSVLEKQMNIEKSDSGRLTLWLGDSQQVEVVPSDLIASIAASLGREGWLFELAEAQSKLADSLVNAIAKNDLPDYPESDQFSRDLTKINATILDCRV